MATHTFKITGTIPDNTFDPFGSASAAQAAAIAAASTDATTKANAAHAAAISAAATDATTKANAAEAAAIASAAALYVPVAEISKVGFSSPFTTNSNTLVDITGVAITLQANSIYQVYAYIVFQSANTSTGFGHTFSFTGSPSRIHLLGQQQRSFSDPITTALNDITASDEVLTQTSVPTANTDMFCITRGVVVTNGGASVMQARLVRGGSANNISARYGYIIATKIA